MGNKYKLTDQGGVAFFQNGGAFLFDELDLPLIQEHTWHHGKRGYPATHHKGKTVVFHKLLYPHIQGEIDHINGDKLDNRRSNLRIVTHQQNAFNQKRRCTNTSGFIGVSGVKDSDCFEAYIHIHGRKHHLGIFDSVRPAEFPEGRETGTWAAWLTGIRNVNSWLPHPITTRRARIMPSTSFNR